MHACTCARTHARARARASCSVLRVSLLARAREAAYYVQKTEPERVASIEGVKRDKFGGVSLAWARHGGAVEAFRLARQAAGWGG